MEDKPTQSGQPQETKHLVKKTLFLILLPIRKLSCAELHWAELSWAELSWGFFFQQVGSFVFQLNPLWTSRSKSWSSGNVASKSISRRLYDSCFIQTVDCMHSHPKSHQSKPSHNINCTALPTPNWCYLKQAEILCNLLLKTDVHSLESFDLLYSDFSLLLKSKNHSTLSHSPLSSPKHIIWLLSCNYDPCTKMEKKNPSKKFPSQSMMTHLRKIVYICGTPCVLLFTNKIHQCCRCSICKPMVKFH